MSFSTSLRRRVARGAERWLGRLGLVAPRAAAASPAAGVGVVVGVHAATRADAEVTQADAATAHPAARPHSASGRRRSRKSAASVSAVDVVAAPVLDATPAPVLDATPAPSAATAPSPTLEAVQEVLDALVRPALQSDGGDIELLGVADGRITVRLVGACGSCPSSTITMQAGVERLLAAELPGFRELIQAPAEV